MKKNILNRHDCLQTLNAQGSFYAEKFKDSNLFLSWNFDLRRRMKYFFLSLKKLAEKFLFFEISIVKNYKCFANYSKIIYKTVILNKSTVLNIDCLFQKWWKLKTFILYDFMFRENWLKMKLQHIQHILTRYKGHNK